MIRREFLGQASGAVSVVALPSLPWWARAEGIEAWLGGMFEDPAAARTIGKAYLDQAGPVVDLPAVLAQLSEKLGPSLAHDSESLENIRERITRRIRLDFAQGDCVNLDGWILSVTEARLCALAALRP